MKIPVNVKRTSQLLIASSLILASLPLLAQEQPTPEPPKAVDLTWGVKIPMRDGVKLNATVYRPKDQKEKLPVIFELTPYISDNYHGRAYYFAQHGYVFALVDVRGRGNSAGQFDPFQQEPQDGHDVVEWLATQPWSNGKVAMWGGSYAGYDQWLTLREFPAHLATIVPAAAAHAGVDFPMFKGIWAAYDMQWLTFTSGVTPQQNLFGESSFWIEKFRELYLSHRPYKDLDKIVGDDSTVFQKWIAHPAFDAYWQKLDISPEQYKKISIPILTITGDYDGDQAGAMTYYRDHMKYGTEEAKAKHYLIIGPWDHAGTRTPSKEVGGLTFADASMLDMNKLHVDWYDWTMKNGKPPEFLKKHVAYYVTGAEQWKYADSLEAISNAKRILYLNSSNGEANDAFHSGSLTEDKPGARKPDQYVYDPLDVRPAELEREDIKNNITDERYALNLFGERRRVSQPALHRRHRNQRFREAGGVDVDGRARHRFQCELVRDYAGWQEHPTHGRRIACPLPGFREHGKVGQAGRNQPLRIQRIYILLTTNCERKPPAAGADIPEQHLHGEKLQQRRRGGRRIRERRAHRACHALSRRRSPQFT